MTLLLGLISQIAKPSAVADSSSVIGMWKCTVNDVPVAYANSIITFIEKEGKLTGIVKFENGTEINISSVKYAGGRLVLILYVEGSEITVDGKVEGTKITGEAVVPDGKVVFTASKIVEKKKH